MEDNPKHDIESLWTNQRKTEAEVAEQGAKLDILLSGQTRLETTINRMLTAPRESFDFKGVILIALAVAGMAGGLVAATIAPMSASLRKHDQQIMNELSASANHRYKAGLRDGKLLSIETVIEKFMDTTHARLLDLEHHTSSCAATVESIIPWIMAVDNYGSRKHVISAPQALRQAEAEMGK